MRRTLVVLVALLLVVTGMLAAYGVYQQMRGDIVAQHGEQLSDVVYSLDRAAQNRMETYRQALEYVTAQKGFADAEAEWNRTGNAAEILYRMEKSLLMQGMDAKTVLALRDGRVVLSADGSTDYNLPAATDGAFVCTDAAGNGYLGISCEGRDMTYVALIDLHVLCARLVETCAVNSMDSVLLIDGGGTFLVSYQKGASEVVPLTETAAEGSSALALAMQAVGTNRQEVGHFEEESRGGEQTTGYALIGDAASQNGLFTVSTFEAYDAHMQSLNEESVQALICCGVILLGLMLLFSYVNMVTRKNRQAAKEVARLKERQKTLEKINEQTQNLAHHQRLEIIGTLTSSISHEFNNLLTPIMSYSLLTLEKLPADETELYDFVLEIYNASQKAKVIISRLSDLSRKNSPRSFRQVSVDELVKKTLDISMPAKPEGVELKLNLNCWDLRINANEIQICQMLLNLVINAFQAMEEGGILEISTIYDDDDIRIRISDTGSGIPEAIRGKIFEPFFTTKEAGKGTGLGLAIVAQVVEDHKGAIEVSNAPSGGTQFEIRLPRKLEIAE